jgi:hypothetical protein
VKLLLAALLAAVVLAPSAAAAPGLLFGVDDDSLKWYGHTGSLLSIYRGLGLDAVRVTLDWKPGQTFPSGTDLQRVGSAARGIRVVVAVTGETPPVDTASRTQFCGYAANVLRRYPSIRDVAIWTEPNSSSFWKPQKGAAGAYEALLATCWDALHAVQPRANVIATSAPHAKPGRWYADVGKAYRDSGRLQRIFDTVGHNGYPESSAEAPDARHAGRSIDQGDLDRLLAVLHKAFDGTAQPVPGEQDVTVWYLEQGFQSSPAEPELHTGVENDRRPVAEAKQAEQLAAAATLAYCQPAVGGFFNFELRDEVPLEGWQSGLLRPDWSAKPAFLAYRDAVRAVRSGTVRCAAWSASSSRGTGSPSTARKGS